MLKLTVNPNDPKGDLILVYIDLETRELTILAEVSAEFGKV